MLTYQAEYFTEKEILHGWKVPENLIPKITPTLKVLDALRNKYQKPMYILSSYRSPAYNKIVGGAKNSMHLLFNALDFTVRDKDDLKNLYFILNNWDTEHSFMFLPKAGSMGIGLYGKRFIHIDTRATLGRNAPARWNG